MNTAVQQQSSVKQLRWRIELCVMPHTTGDKKCKEDAKQRSKPKQNSTRKSCNQHISPSPPLPPFPPLTSVTLVPEAMAASAKEAATDDTPMERRAGKTES